MIFLFRFFRFTKNFLAHLALVSLILEQFLFVSSASAQTLPITPDGSTNTQVTQTASGIDQVNIAAPNANGMSHNKFTDYNVNASGQIINNFSGSGAVAGTGANAVTQTQIGGLVTTNSNLISSGSAKVILNEVTSGNTSQLLGYAEIAGTKADLILANPNGIACSGCGFINTAHLLMVAGSSNFDASGNLGFNLKEQANPNLYVPLITIDGLGLDITRTTGTDIVASSVKLLSSIYGSDSNSLTIKTGEGRYDYATKNITGNNTQNNTDPVFAIDASALAQIQAGQVYLIATKQGVGVKMESEILASQTLNLDANGDIYYKSISVGDTATLRSSGTIQTTDSNSSISAPTINIQANQFNNLGLASAYNLNIQNSQTLSNSGNLEALNLNLSNITNISNSGSIFGQNSLAISGANLTNNSSGSIYSPQDYAITLTGLLTNSGLITSTNNLTLNSDQLNNSGEVSAQNNLAFFVTDSAINSGNLIAGKTLDFTTTSLNNSGKTQSSNDSNFNVSSLTNSEAASIYSAKNLTLNLSSSLINSGEISSLGNLSVTGNSTITNSSQILSNADLSIASSSLNNDTNGLIASLAKSLTLSLTGNLQNDGDLNAITDTSINSTNFFNSGTIFAGKISSVDGSILSLGNLTINSSNSFANSGGLQSTKNTSVTASSSLSNSGLIKSLGKATINTNSFTNQLNATIASNDDLAITTTSLNNFGSASSQNNFTTNSSSLTNSGSIYSKNNFSITNASDLTNSGTFYSDGSLLVSSNGITNNSSAWIFGSKDVSLISNLDFANSGNLQAITDLTLTIGRNSNNSGSIVGKQLTFTDSDNITNSGEISALDFAIINTSSLTNSGNILANNNLNINSATIDNNGANATIASINQTLVLNLSDYLANSGTIFSKRDLILSKLVTETDSEGVNTTRFLGLNSVNNSGEISFNRLFSTDSKLKVNSELKVKDFTNSGTFASNGVANDLTITSSNSFNNSGTINSSNKLNLNTTSLINSGEIFAANSLQISADGDVTNSGDIFSNAALTIDANNLANNSGNLQSASDFNLTSESLTNSGTIKAFGKSTITSNSIDNQGDGLIFSNSDSAITSNVSFTNSGSILSNGKFDLTSYLTTNNNEIFSAGDLKLNLANTFTNSGSLSSLGNLDILSTSSITNNNQILSGGNLGISATSLINSNTIQSNSNLTLNLTNLANFNNMVSGGTFNITASENIANSGNLESADNFTINAASLTNSASSLILAGKDLTVIASGIDNQNTKPSTSNITSGIVSANGNILLQTDTLNNNSGIIAGRSTTVNALNAASVNLYNTLGAFISTAAIMLNLGALDYTITGTVTASNIDITANKITNQGNVTAADYIKLNATNDIVNGYAPDDARNSNVILAAGSYINFAAQNNIYNYGTILGTTDLTLTANSALNNYGAIKGGSGTTTISVTNGSLNNASAASQITSNNNLIFNLGDDLNNYGEISVQNDLTANVADSLYNYPTALIWSGHDSTFNVANTFLNNQADIYSDRNLTIQKNTSSDSSQNKTNLIQNISGNIETFSGDINIKAITLENKRSSMKSQGADYVYGSAYVTGGDCHRRRGRLKCNPRIYRDLHAANILGIAGLEASVLSGGGINISSNSFLNDASSIISSANAGIDTSLFNNNSYTFVQYDDSSRRYEYYTAYIKSGGSLTITQNGAVNPSLVNGSNVIPYVPGTSNPKQSRSTTINHIDSYQLSKDGILNVDLSQISSAISKNSVISNGSSLSISTVSNSSPTSVVASSIHKGSVSNPSGNIDNSSLSSPNASITPSSLAASGSNTVFSGNFKINLDPAATTPLVESRSQFTDASKFFGSSYYFNQLGLNGNSVLLDLDRQTRNSTSTRMLGDSFVETKLILDQLKTLTNDSLLLSKNTTDHNQQIKELLDNSVNQFAALGLNAEDVAIHGLTSAQANLLTKDIVTFEMTKVNGVSVLAPKIYLSQDTRNRLFNNLDQSTGGTSLASSSTLFGKESLVIDSPSANLLNTGSIASSGNLALNLASLTNKTNSIVPAQITAGNSLNITAQTGDIKNIGANIGSIGALSLVAAKGNILNTAIVQTNDANLLAQSSDSYKLGFGTTGRTSGNIKSELLQNASIKGGSISINAANDFTNLAAKISATKNTLADGSTSSGNLSIAAGDDVNIGTLQLHNRTETSWGSKKKGGTSITDTTTNIASDFSSAGSVTLVANGTGTDSETSRNLQGSNIQITGSNIAATDNITIAAKDDVVIQAAQNTSHHESQSWKKGATVAKSSISGSDSTTNVLSTLTSTSGNILLTSGSDTNIIGAKLKADDVAINAGAEINVYSVSDKNSSWSSSSKSRNLSAITKPLVALAVVSPEVTLGGALATAVIGDAANHSSKSSSDSKEKTSNLSSVIEAKGDVVLASNHDLTISGSDVSGKTGNLTSDQGDVNILAAIEMEKTSSSSKSASRETHVPGLKGSKKSSDSTNETVTNVASNLTFTDSLAINTNGNSSGNSLNSDQKSDIKIKGSNLTVSGGDLTLASAGNITVENAVDSTLNESSSKKRNESIKSIQKSVDYIEHAVSSNLNANNINIQSRGDTTIQGSNINTSGNLVVGSFTIAQNPDGTYQKDSGGNYVTTSGSTVDNLTIKNADLKEYHYAQSSKGYVGVAGAAMQAVPYVLAPLQVASDLTKNYMSTYFPDFYEDFIMKATPIGWSMTAIDKAGDKLGAIRINSETETRTDKTTSYASNINVGGSMMTNSVGNSLIQGSNLNVNGNLLANSLGNFTVAASQNTESTTSQSSYETAGKFHSEYRPTHLSYRAGTTKEFVEEGSESDSTTLTSSNINVGGSALVNSSDQFALIASNFITTGSAEIISKNNLNISDAQNTQSTSSYLDKLTLDTGVQVGNAYADAAYAIVDAAKAQKAVKDAYDKLEKIEDLRDQDMASSKAVERAKYQVVLALINAGLSSAAAMQAVGNAGAAASTSFGTGFYGSVYADITKLKSTTTSEYAQSIASNLISGDNLSLTSGTGDINITGSNVSSQNGDLNLTAMLGNFNVKAGESTYSQSSKMRSQNLGGSVGNNGFSANIGFNEAESSLDQTSYANSQLTAENGTLKITTKQDANIVGANLLAKDINLDIGKNLLVKSKQNLAESDSYSIGMSLGISGDSSGVNGGSIGFNLGNGYSNRAWVDQLTSIVGTNSVTINTANDTNIIGAMIANKDANGNDLGNLTLNTKSLTYSDLKNFSVSESNSLGINLSAGKNPNNPTANGSLAISLAMNGNESSSDTKATIGKGSININNATATESQLAGLNRNITNVEANKKDVITSDFNASLKIDLRLIAAAGNLAIGNTEGASANWNSYSDDTARGKEEAKKDLRFIGEGLENVRTTTDNLSDKNLGDSIWSKTATTLLTSPISAIEGAIFTFLETNDQNGSQLYKAVYDKSDNWSFKLVATNDSTEGRNYALNGIITDRDSLGGGYFGSSEQTSDLVIRHNPTHGFIGDLIESGIGKIANAINTPEIVAMNRIVVDDLYQRKSISDATNAFHSQGTIIGVGAMKLYSQTYIEQIDQTQRFVAVGPAVLESDWMAATKNLDLVWNRKNYQQDPLDPVRYLTAPDNLINSVGKVFNQNINSPIYIPNPLTTLYGIGIGAGMAAGMVNPYTHNISNPTYSQFLKDNQSNTLATQDNQQSRGGE